MSNTDTHQYREVSNMSVDRRWFLTEEDKKEYIDKLTEVLSSLRTKADISQGELAYMIGVSRQTYSSIECKRRDMSWETFLSLIFFFDSVKVTHVMLRSLGVYPASMVAQFNNDPRPDDKSEEERALGDIAKIVSRIQA
jgi:DNA-binding XRE family transcriptional regulator